MSNRIAGILDPFWETGTEGVIWAVINDDPKLQGYEKLTILTDGDYLFVEDGEGGIIWEGEIKLEYERKYRPFPNNPESGQQEIFGYWVHGFQESEEPETWATWFFEGRRAVLIKKDYAPITTGSDGTV